MAERKTVMSWLEGLAQDDWPKWHSDSEVQEIAKAALELLKEQEPVKPEYKLIPGSEKIHEWECGNCGYSLFMILSHENRYSAKSVVRYCAGCGRAVKWDD